QLIPDRPDASILVGWAPPTEPQAPQEDRWAVPALRVVGDPQDSGSPVEDGAVVRVVFLLVLPVVAELVGEGVLVELDAEAGAPGEVEVAVADDEGGLEVALAEAHLLLAEEIRDRRGDLDARGERDRAEGVVGGDGRVVRLGHAGDQAD